MSARIHQSPTVEPGAEQDARGHERTQAVASLTTALVEAVLAGDQERTRALAEELRELEALLASLPPRRAGDRATWRRAARTIGGGSTLPAIDEIPCVLVLTVVHGDFEWDADKAATNIAKHGVSFEEAASAMSAPASQGFADGLQSRTSSRW